MENLQPLWPGGPLYAGTGFPVSTDGVLLSEFAPTRSFRRCMDLGCGAGLLLLRLAAKNPSMSLAGIELCARAAQQAKGNLAVNGLNGEIVCGDLRACRSMFPAGSFDLVVSNPPYYPAGSGKLPANADQALARSELACTLEDVCQAAAWLCRNAGAFAVVHKPEHLSRLLVCMSQVRLEPKRLRLVCHRPGATPSLVLVEGRLGAKPGLKIEPPLVLVNPDGSDSDEAKRMYRR